MATDHDKISSRQLVTALISDLAETQQRSASNTANSLVASDDDDIKNTLLTLHAIFPVELLSALDLLDRRLVHCFRVDDSRTAAAQDEETQSEAPDQSKRRRLDDSYTAGMTSPNTALDSSQAQRQVVRADHAPSEAVPGKTEDTQTQHGIKRLSHRSTSDDERENAETGSARPTDVAAGGAVIDDLYYVRSAQQQRMASRARWRDETPTHYEVRLTAWSCSCPAFSFSAFPPDTSSHDEVQQTGDHGRTAFGGISSGGDLAVCKHILACYLAARCHAFKQSIEVRVVTMAEVVAWAAGWGD